MYVSLCVNPYNNVTVTNKLIDDSILWIYIIKNFIPDNINRNIIQINKLFQ